MRLAAPASRKDAPGPVTTTGAIAVERLTVAYGRGKSHRVAIQDTTFAARPGEFVALLGPSGCGKTTLLHTIAGFVQPTQGVVSIDGRRVREPSGECGVVFQQHSLFPWMTALQNVAFGPQMRGWRNPGDIARRCLALVGLGDFVDAYPADLSGGMRQRVGLARALAVEPAVLLMDEPFGALDALTRELMQELLLRVWERRRPTVVFVTHDIDEALFLADRIVIMGTRPGRIRQEITVDFPRPRSAEIRGLAEFGSLRTTISRLVREESLRNFNGEEER